LDFLKLHFIQSNFIFFDVKLVHHLENGRS